MLSGISLVSAIAFANLLPEETFGFYRFVLSVLGILTLSTLVGMEPSLLRSVSRGFGNTLYAIMRVRILFGLLGTLGALAIATYYYLHNNHMLAGAFLLAAPFIPLLEPLTLYNTFIAGLGQFKAVATNKFIVHSTSLIFLVATLLLTDNLLFVLAAYLLPLCVMRSLLLVRSIRIYTPQGGTEPGAVRYGFQLSVLKSALGVTGHLQQIALYHFLGPVSVAVYYFANAPIEQVRGTLSNLQTLLFRKTAVDTWHIGSIRSLLGKLAPSLLVLGGGTIAYILVAPLLFSVLFPTYIESVLYTQLLAPAILVTAINMVLQTFAQSKGKVRMQYAVGIVHILTQILITIPLIAVYGLTGLVSGIYINKLLNSITLLVCIFRQKDSDSVYTNK